MGARYTRRHPVTVGVAVEGPSDRTFLDKVLHKHFRSARFDVRSMNGRERLICSTPQLLETFRSAHYAAGFVILDCESDPCHHRALEHFNPDIRREFSKPSSERFLFVCVAIRGLECWLLADELAIRSVLPAAAYECPSETAALNPGRVLQELWRQQHGIAAFDKIEFAKSIAPRFDPTNASAHSASFAYFWTKLKLALKN